MARVRVRIEDFEDGVLPDVCVSSGAPADGRSASSISTRTSGWLWLFVFAGPFGIVGALVLASVLRKTAHGRLPYARAVQDRLAERMRTYAWFAVSSIGLFAGGLALAQADGFGPVGTVVMFGAAFVGAFFVFLWSNPPGSVGGHLDSTGRWVELDPVSPRFAAAYERQEADRRAARRAEVRGTRQDH